jgi:cellulose synthase (UDP-forming)
MQLFIRDNPIFKRGLTIAQRICHLGSISHYFDGFQKAIYYFTPIAVLTTGILPIKTINIEFLIRFVPHLLLSLWAYEEMSRGFGRTFLIEQYNMIRFFTYMKSVVGFLKLKGLKFKVTPKTEYIKTGLGMLIPQALVISGSLLAVIYAVSGLAHYNLESSAIIANIIWTTVHAGIAYTAVKYALNKVQRRNDFRFPVNIPAVAALSNPGIMPLAITDLHEKGAAFSAFKRFEKGAVLPVSLSIAGKTLNAAVRVLHVKQKNISGVSVFYHGTEFVDLPAENRDAITGFNFSYGVNKMMICLNISKETPLSRLLRLISGRTFLKREERQSVQIPGTYRSNGTQWLPFVTEDISGGGMRISSYTDIRKPVISMNFFYGKECRLLRGKIVWKQDIDLHGSRAYLYGIKFLMESRELVHLSLPGDLPAFDKSYSRRSI